MDITWLSLQGPGVTNYKGFKENWKRTWSFFLYLSKLLRCNVYVFKDVKHNFFIIYIFLKPLVVIFSLLLCLLSSTLYFINKSYSRTLSVPYVYGRIILTDALSSLHTDAQIHTHGCFSSLHKIYSRTISNNYTQTHKSKSRTLTTELFVNAFFVIKKKSDKYELFWTVNVLVHKNELLEIQGASRPSF